MCCVVTHLGLRPADGIATACTGEDWGQRTEAVGRPPRTLAATSTLPHRQSLMGSGDGAVEIEVRRQEVPTTVRERGPVVAGRGGADGLVGGGGKSTPKCWSTNRHVHVPRRRREKLLCRCGLAPVGEEQGVSRPRIGGVEAGKRCGLAPMGWCRSGATTSRRWGWNQGGTATSCRWARRRR